MPQYVAFLRAINVTGRFIKMVDLAEHVRTLGHTNVKTYINSGNVLFQSRQLSTSRLATALEDGLEPLLGFRAEAFVRAVPELQAVAAQALALRSRIGPEGDINVAFLQRELTADDEAAIAPLRNTQDDFVCDGQELYWICQSLQSQSKFSNAVLERKLRTRATLRRGSMLQGLLANLAAA
ncbi:DUF1697 domain-containing protein [Rhodoferax sp. AJA081-3]|uniref:DUF1697 domain-containing protein n=1 Tax=Rhodoferax sp. AJA081-3 TaxID=2752316 RepID=UPI001AE05D66|nr:DUF1697 domain-containing protein [Rhodoferax sp. AJA081-3]QTN29875.1 DUF1697 domain-containing protein [Rhodoferax sp. AJA081-3]